MTTSAGASYSFIYDTTAGIPAVLMEREGTQTPKLYIRTPDGRLIARVTAIPTTPTLDFYYHFDGLGSTKALTYSNGDTTDTYTYDVWGQVTHSGETDQPYQFVGQLGYYTHYQDSKLSPESTDADKYAMLQLGVRYYVPQVGRFAQRDPIGDRGGLNVYQYAQGDPVGLVDPVGMEAVSPLPLPDPITKPVIGVGKCVVKFAGLVVSIVCTVFTTPTPVNECEVEWLREQCLEDCADQMDNNYNYCKARYPGDSTKAKKNRSKCYEQSNDLYSECYDRCMAMYPLTTKK